ncbi:MAG: hypothetical protein K9N51_12470 [Candidatus Pacebacteria bacterium]|nr:hypothetical protein [Candidatus Paceibacterota bacterium]
MNAALVSAHVPYACEPLTCTRTLGDCPVGNRPLREWQVERAQAHGLQLTDPESVQSLTLFIPENVWLADSTLAEAAKAEAPVVFRDTNGRPLAWVHTKSHLHGISHTCEVAGDSFAVTYVWQLLDVNSILLGDMRRDTIAGDIADGVTIDGHLSLGAGSRLLPGVYIEGNVVIGRDCKIGPNCYLRGSASIGDGCHIGQAVEVKNSIVMSGSSLGHLSYCGDSIIGRNVNFGAGTITANFRHDGTSHRSMVDGELVDTGRCKFGTIMGDDVHTGIHTSIYPGRKLWPHTSTRPGDVVKYDCMAG